MDSTDEQIREVVKKVNDYSINLYGGGVITMKTRGTMDQAFEYEKDPEDLLPGLAESVGYVRGVVDTLL